MFRGTYTRTWDIIRENTKLLMGVRAAAVVDDIGGGEEIFRILEAKARHGSDEALRQPDHVIIEPNVDAVRDVGVEEELPDPSYVRYIVVFEGDDPDPRVSLCEPVDMLTVALISGVFPEMPLIEVIFLLGECRHQLI